MAQQLAAITQCIQEAQYQVIAGHIEALAPCLTWPLQLAHIREHLEEAALLLERARVLLADECRQPEYTAGGTN